MGYAKGTLTYSSVVLKKDEKKEKPLLPYTVENGVIYFRCAECSSLHRYPENSAIPSQLIDGVVKCFLERLSHLVDWERVTFPELLEIFKRNG
jgi:hypothetical protein